MLLKELNNSIERTNALNDLDNFTASPQLTLKPATIDYLVKNYPEKTNRTLYRILFADSESTLKKILHTDKLDEFEKCKHSSTRCTSWTTSFSVTKKMLKGDDVWENFACIIKAVINGSDIVIDVERLSIEDKKEVYLLDQKEVIVKPGNYSAEIVIVHEYKD